MLSQATDFVVIGYSSNRELKHELPCPDAGSVLPGEQALMTSALDSAERQKPQVQVPA